MQSSSGGGGGVISALCRVGVPRELLLHRDFLMPPLVIGFERFEENIWKIEEDRVG